MYANSNEHTRARAHTHTSKRTFLIDVTAKYIYIRSTDNVTLTDSQPIIVTIQSMAVIDQLELSASTGHNYKFKKNWKSRVDSNSTENQTV